jgi:hypothetical protein
MTILCYFKTSLVTFVQRITLKSMFSKKAYKSVARVHDRETRNMNDLDVPVFKTNSGQRTFKFRATKLWNDLDCKFKDIRGRLFKGRLVLTVPRVKI